MKRNFLRTFLCLILILIMILWVNPFIIKSYGSTYTYTLWSNDLPANFDSLYPGYSNLLNNMASNHPNWTFKLYETGLDWDTVLNNECVGHGSSAKNLSPANNSSYSGEWICAYCGAVPCESGAWYCTSRNGIAYMMDPRNSLNDTDIFQFQELYSSSADTYDVVKLAVSGSFIDNDECINAIVSASNSCGINSLHLVSRILQEQGYYGSTLGKGITENGVTYYNFFNIGAYGDSSATIINRGLQTAKDNGWTSKSAAITGGANFLKDNYINKGQNTMYYQKFNVVYQDSLYNHQYMQNVLAAQNEGTKMRSYYISAGKFDSNFVFNIPLYNNMPGSACARPDTNKPSEKIELQDGELAYVNTESSALGFRDSPNGNRIGELPKGTQVSVLEKGTEEIGGYHWHKVSTPIGIGYVAAEYLLIPSAYSIEGEYMIVAPTTKVDSIQGVINNSSYFGTGSTVTLNENTYTVIMLGDANCDGNITPSDYVKVKNHIMGVSYLDGSALKGADVNKDGQITPADYVKIKNHIMSVSRITL